LFYWLTEHPVFGPIGLFCILAGIILFIFGAAALANTQSGPRGLILALMLSNFPLALMCGALSAREMGTHRIDILVVNASDRPIDSAVATFDKAKAIESAIGPGTSRRLRLVMFAVHRDDVRLSISRGDQTEHIKLGSYDSDDLFETRTIRIEVANDGFRNPT